MKTQRLELFGATLTRRRFLQGGALVAGFILAGKEPWTVALSAVHKYTPDPTKFTSWFQVNADNTMVMFTGKVDFGQSSAFTAFRQIAADELHVPFEAITEVVVGDTDRTPDGGLSSGFLRGGTPNVRKAAAYAYQALLELAAAKIGVEKSALSVNDGVVSGGGQTLTFGQLVAGEQSRLAIPLEGVVTHQPGLTVVGDPPLRPVHQYKVIGRSYKNPETAAKVTAKTTWVSDVRVPGMLHGRVVHPKTLGSTLVSAGAIDTNRFPNARLVVQKNLVGVVAPTEWEAIRAASQVAADTKWTDWAGLPTSDELFAHLRTKADWMTAPVRSGGTQKTEHPEVLKKVSATYEVPYLKHAPIGPSVAVADVRSDGMVYVHASCQHPSMLRGELARNLSISPEQVVVRWYPGTGQYGRSTSGTSGAEDEAVILSKAVGAPVRVHWTRADDFVWSASGSFWYSDIEVGVDANNKLSKYQADHYMAPKDDSRSVGAILAGLPTQPPPAIKEPPENYPSVGTIVNTRWDPWLYGSSSNVLERCYGTFQVGEKESPIAVGLRDVSMRTPGQLGQNFARELALTELAVLAGVDPLQFRLDNTENPRVKNVLLAVRDALGWEPGSWPKPAESRADVVRGRGVSAMQRGAYWACTCEVAIDTRTGKITVERMAVAVDPGIVINPLQLKRQVEGGTLMGISIALHEEMTFDRSTVKNIDWRTYPILTMAETPELKVVLIHNPAAGNYQGASEAANAIPESAIAGAVLDATGKAPRRLPLRSAYMLQLLKD